MNETPLLTLLTFLPLVGALAVLIQPKEEAVMHRMVALGFSGLSLIVAFLLWFNFDTEAEGMQFVHRLPWIPEAGVNYHLGIDGIGLLMIALTSLLVPFSLFLSPGGEGRGYYALILFLQTGLFGTFTALNFIHWFVFWELALIPAFFLVRNWGGPRADAVSMQFFIYTMVGSVALLLGFLALYLAAFRLSAENPFSFIELASLGSSGQLAPSLAVALDWFDTLDAESGIAVWVFLLVFLGFAVKLPIWPFHTWLPSTYSEAPAPVTMLLTGAMSKMGAYGLIRILLPIFPDQIQQLQTPLLLLTVASIVFGAAAALAQKDLKRILAYSSINHLGYVAMAVFAAAAFTSGDARWLTEKTAAVNGALLQMFNHGVIAATLFGFVALIERRSKGETGIGAFGGLRKVAPVFTGLMGIAMFASLGLPGLSGFVGEFLIFKGAFALAPWAAVCAVPGLLLTALFFLNIMKNVFSGPLNEHWKHFTDLNRGELLIMIPPTALMLIIGFWPESVVGIFNSTVTRMLEGMGS